MAGRQAPKVGLDPDVATAIATIAQQFGGNRTVAVNWLLRQQLGLIPSSPTVASVAPPSPTVAPALPEKPTVERQVTPSPISSYSELESNVRPLVSKADRFKAIST